MISPARAQISIARKVQWFTDRAAAALLLCVLPLALAPGVFFFFDVTPKVLALYLGAALAIASLAIQLPDWSLRRPARPLVLLPLVFILSLLISTAGSTDLAVSIFGSDWRRFGLAAQLALCAVGFWLWVRLRTESGFGRLCLILITAAGLAASLYGLAQFFGFDPFLDARYYRVDLRPGIITRPPSTFGHAMYFANFCLYAMGCGMAVARTDKTIFTRTLGYGTAVAASAALVATGTRAALVGLVTGIVAVWVMSNRRLRPWLVGCLLGTAVLAAALFWLGGSAGFKSKLLRDPGGSRLMLWRDSVQMALRGPVFGYGPEVFAREAPKFRASDTASTFPDNYDESPHNIFLDSWIGSGLAGLLSIIGLAAVAAAALARLTTANPAWGLPLFGTFIAALVSQQFSCFTLPTVVCFLVVCMIGVTLRAHPSGGGNASWPRWVWRSACLPLAAISCWVAVVTGIPDWERGRLPRLMAAGKVHEGIDAYREGNSPNPLGTAADLWFCRRMNEVYRRTRDAALQAEVFRASLEAAARSTRDADSPSLGYYEMATLHASAGKPDLAEAELRRSLEWSPKWYRAHWALAEIMAAEGRRAEARAEAQLALNYCTQTNPDYRSIITKLRTLASVPD